MTNPEKQSLGHILLLDDDAVFRDALSKMLADEGYRVTALARGDLAKQAIEKSAATPAQAISLVISDINMPGMTGIELMNSLKKESPDLPVILMTGFAELKETKEAYDLGARGFLPKPFKKEDLFQVLAEAKLDGENVDLDFCKLNIDDFVTGREIKFDIYVRLSEKKYLKIAHQGEDIPIERINAYKAKSILHLYMSKQDFKNYMGFNIALLPAVKKSGGITKEKKRAFLKHTSDVLLEHMHLSGVDVEALENAKTIVESTTALMTEPDDMLSLLMALDSHADFLYTHALGVSTYSVMVARQVQWHSPANLFKVAIGGLLHDIGKKEIPRNVLLKSRREMTPEEIQLYETHPQRGLDILSQIPGVPNDALQIVFQHHENCLGFGFPSRLSKSHIHPMARLAAVANDFCALVLKGPEQIASTPVEVIQKMQTLQAGKYDAQFLQGLMRVFKIPEADGLGEGMR